jgi:luciferase family oxidoreductase group 1
MTITDPAPSTVSDTAVSDAAVSGTGISDPGGPTGLERDRRGVALSVLDLATVGAGATPGEALRDTTELAVLTESLGYRRFWVAEHHGMPAVASASPPVLLAHLGAATSRIRLGSGGVMLPNHAPLAVAEQFSTLTALHPDRIDLGLGRAPGTDQLTAYALRRHDSSQGDDMADRLGELRHFLDADFPADHPFRRVRLVPAGGRLPIWLLGSSDYSARLAARLGLPFAFAHHFAGQSGSTEAALSIYRATFRPSELLDRPYSMVGVTTLAADDEETAEYEAMAGALSMVLLRSGRLQETPTPEQAAAYRYSRAERDLMTVMRGTEIVGTPDAVAAGLDALAERLEVDELMVTTRVHGAAARRRSFELVADAWARRRPLVG